jgi:hypothetical protein
MLRISPLITCAVLALTACATVGPTASQVESALAEANPATAAPTVRDVRCETFEEEPTEFHCRWRQRDASGTLKSWSAYFAVDSRGYSLIDDVAPAGRTK